MKKNMLFLALVLIITLVFPMAAICSEKDKEEDVIEEPPVDEPQELAENELYWGLGLEAIDEYDLEGDFVTFDQIGIGRLRTLWQPVVRHSEGHI